MSEATTNELPMNAKPPFSILTGTETEIWPADYGLPHPNHCRDVLDGSYDVPFDPPTPPVVLDLGANAGAFVRWAVQRWPGCTVHAYEPQPDNFKLLLRTVAALPAKDKITCHEVAVSDDDSGADLRFDGLNCGEWSLTSPGDKGRCKVATIDAAKLPKADVLKLDVEGHELIILGVLDARLPEFSAIMMECHADFIVAPIKARLAQHGFTLTGEKTHFQHRVELRFVKTSLLSQP